MIFRFAPSRFVVLLAVLATGVAAAPDALQGQTAKAAQQQSPYPGTVVEDIVARINDQVISTSDYDRALQDLEQQAQQHQWTQQQLFEQKQNLLRDLIDQQLLISRGKELDITGETQLVKQLDEMRKEYHLDSMDDLQKAAEAQGVSWEDFKANMRNHIIAQQVIRDEVGQHINITPTEVQSYYNAHKQDFNQPEQVRLSEILIPTANPDDAAQVAEAKKKADDAEAKLKGGADFAELAKSSSSGVTAANGGDLGEFKRGQLAKVLEDQTFDLKPGEYTEPIRTKQGWVVLKVTQHTAGGIAPLKDVEPQVEEAIGMAKMNPALREYMTKLREDSYIEIKNGYEDSGASPNEMKPVYTAYTPPTAKKKKRVQRTRFNGRGRKAGVEPASETASETPAAPANVPSLADVPQGSAAPTKKQIAAAKQVTMKPGKKEKIRFGQAPRETLPSAETKTEDAGPSTEGGNGGETQVAANNTSPDVGAANESAPDQPEAKRVKTRFSAVKRPKGRKGPKVDPFAPSPETKEEIATRKQQAQPLGLNGDNSKKKKSPRKEGPKRRMSDEKKNEAQPAAPNSDSTGAPAPAAPAPDSTSAPATAPDSTPAPAPAPANPGL
ncbi:MAG TPA: peptidyl-prolyl cis-trans isomerase [Silvibacterium sp.]|nr:peptidyl-prolyl cis-trans isomerase [Silvibacterium sp.]